MTISFPRSWTTSCGGRNSTRPTLLTSRKSARERSRPFSNSRRSICQLTGMDVANASVYDGASAVAEGVLMAQRIKGRKKCLLARSLHPEYRTVTQTYTHPLELDLVDDPLHP